MDELRCDGTMHGKLIDATHLEVKCKRRICGYKPDTIVLHTFDLETGEYTTRRFADPRYKRGKVTNDTAQPVTAVRTS